MGQVENSVAQSFTPLGDDQTDGQEQNKQCGVCVCVCVCALQRTRGIASTACVM